MGDCDGVAARLDTATGTTASVFREETSHAFHAKTHVEFFWKDIFPVKGKNVLRKFSGEKIWESGACVVRGAKRNATEGSGDDREKSDRLQHLYTWSEAECIQMS